MILINRDKFYTNFRKNFGPLTQSLVDALNQVLTSIEQDTSFNFNDTDRQKLAYILATFKWETAHTFLPIDEHGSDDYFNKRYGPGTKVGKMLGNTQPGDGALFHGRGYVQLTGRTNYTRGQQVTGQPLISNPDLAKDHHVAYTLAIHGMKEGWFTGRKLDNYMKPGKQPDYVNARRIINGLDQANKIADIATRMDAVLATCINQNKLTT